jgi:hypothetical protein
MKRIFLILPLLFIGLMAFSQNDINRTTPIGNVPANTATYNKRTVNDANLRANLTLYIPNGVTPTLNNAKDSSGAVFFKVNASSDTSFYANIQGSGWVRFPNYNKIVQLIGSSSPVLLAGAITSLPTVGYNPGSNITTAQFITNSFYQTQPPTSGLSGGGNYELHSAGTFASTLNWIGGRQSATNPLATINVAGINQTFTQPSAGASTSGTQGVTVTWNTNATYYNTVTTTDSKTATSSTGYAFYPSRYWGRSAITAPTTVILLATAGGSSELTGGKAKSGFTISASGSNYVYYAYPSSFGDLTSILVGGFESISSFTKTILSVTNASGYVQNYTVYTSNNTFSATTPSIIVN